MEKPTGESEGNGEDDGELGEEVSHLDGFGDRFYPEGGEVGGIEMVPGTIQCVLRGTRVSLMVHEGYQRAILMGTVHCSEKVRVLGGMGEINLVSYQSNHIGDEALINNPHIQLLALLPKFLDSAT